MENVDGIQIWDTKEEDESHKTDWHQNIKVMTPIALAGMFASYMDCDDNIHFIKTFLIWFTWGLVFMWTFMEYLQHRFLLHREVNLDPEAPWTKESGEANADNFTVHIHHHVFMNQKHRIALPLKMYAQYLFLSFCLLKPICSHRTLWMQGAGGVFGSLIYDGIHLMYHFKD